MWAIFGWLKLGFDIKLIYHPLLLYFESMAIDLKISGFKTYNRGKWEFSRSFILRCVVARDMWHISFGFDIRYVVFASTLAYLLSGHGKRKIVSFLWQRAVLWCTWLGSLKELHS